MISNPKYGWCTFEIGDFHSSISYITDVPMELLNCFINFFENNSSCISFDSENNGTFILILSDINIYIIKEDYKPILYSINTNNKSIFEYIYDTINEIEVNIDKWSIFSVNPFFEEEVKKEKENLILKINKIKDYLSNYIEI